jgi:tight adherence protein C
MTPAWTALAWLGIALVTAGTATFVYLVLRAPPRPPVRLGIRGFKRQRALHDPLWPKIDLPVRWLGARIGRLMPDDQVSRIDRQLVLAGDWLGLSAPEYVALSVLALVAGAAAGLVAVRFVHMGPLLVLAGALLGGALPYLVVSGEAESRQKRIDRRLPGIIDLIALAMDAGLDFPGAIRQVVEKSSDPYDPLIEELGWILHKLQLGHTRRQALEELAVRAPRQAVVEFVGAVIQAEERGHPIARVLQIQATTSRERRSTTAEESAAKAGVALAGPLLLLFLAILLLIMSPMVLRLGHSGIFRE